MSCVRTQAAFNRLRVTDSTFFMCYLRNPVSSDAQEFRQTHEIQVLSVKLEGTDPCTKERDEKLETTDGKRQEEKESKTRDKSLFVHRNFLTKSSSPCF